MSTEIAFHQRFVNSSACLDYLEEMRWAETPICAHCFSGNVYICRSRRIYKCAACLRQFTVRTGTIFENTRLPLTKWFLGVYLLTAYKAGASSVQLASRLDITQKSAWRMVRYIRGMISSDEKPKASRRLQPLKTDLTFDQLMLRIVRAADGR